MTFMIIVLLGGAALIWFARANPPPLTRGAAVGEHWHASYRIDICGKRMSNYPTVEGELHSHGDGFMHIHPHTPAGAGDFASLGTFLGTYETSLSADAKGKRTLAFPDGTKYSDGDTCSKKDKKKHNIVVTNKGKKVNGDPSAFLPHEGDAIEIAFGPKGDKKTMPNPYAAAKGLPDPGTGGATPAPDTAPAQQQPPMLPEETEKPKKKSSKNDDD